MKWWNLAFNIASALGSIGTFITFLFLFFDKKKEYKKIKSKKDLALGQLKFLKYETNNLMKNILFRETKNILFNDQVSKELDELILDISEILGYKIIGDDICSSLSTLRYRILNITRNIKNNILKQSQADKLETTIHLLEKYIDIAIKRLE